MFDFCCKEVSNRKVYIRIVMDPAYLFNMDPDPTFYFADLDSGPDSDPTFHFDAEPVLVPL